MGSEPTTECRVCYGRGELSTYQCSVCEGSGRVPASPSPPPADQGEAAQVLYEAMWPDDLLPPWYSLSSDDKAVYRRGVEVTLAGVAELEAVRRAAWALCDDTEGTPVNDEDGQQCLLVPKASWDRLCVALDAIDSVKDAALRRPPAADPVGEVERLPGADFADQLAMYRLNRWTVGDSPYIGEFAAQADAAAVLAMLRRIEPELSAARAAALAPQLGAGDREGVAASDLAWLKSVLQSAAEAHGRAGHMRTLQDERNTRILAALGDRT